MAPESPPNVGQTGRVPAFDRELKPEEAIPEIPNIIHEMLMAGGWNPAAGERAWQVVNARYGLVGEPHTLEEVGAVLGVTRERVRQIQSRAMAQLSDVLRMHFVGERYRLQPHTVAWITAILSAGPGPMSPLVFERRLLANIGVESAPSESTIRSLSFLFALRSVQRRGSAGHSLGPVWISEPDGGRQLLDAMERVEDALTVGRELIGGATALEIAIEATKRQRRFPLRVDLVETILPQLDWVESLEDGRIRAKAECLQDPVDQVWRLLAERNGPQPLDDLLRQINSWKRVGESPIWRATLANQLSLDDRFVAIARTGYWGLSGRDGRLARPVKETVLDVLRTLGRPVPTREIRDVVAHLRPGSQELVDTYLYQLQGSRVVHLTNGDWALIEWREAKQRGGVHQVQRRARTVTLAQAKIDAELVRVLERMPSHEGGLGEVAELVARATGTTSRSIQYRIGRSTRVEPRGPMGRKRRVRLVETSIEG